MTTLDNKTLEYIMESLGYHYESQNGPREQIFTAGPNMHDYRFYTAWDLREWLAGLMHRTTFEFMIDGKPDNGDFDRRPTEIKVTCSCGEFEEIRPVVPKEWKSLEATMSDIAGEHVRTSTKATLDRYKYDENYGDVDD